MTVPSLSQEELQALEILMDPCQWATLELDWQARWYQEEMMKSKSNRVVIRAGRRVGKTDAMVVNMLHRCYTNNDFRILIVTPFETQIKHIFDRIRQFKSKSRNLRASIIRDIRSPNEIEFGNGSKIAGFTAGTTSGGGAANVRGQGADLIYLDEADYLSNDDIDTIISVAYEDAERIQIWATSTPTGKRGRFWEWCTKPELGWDELHYTSHVNPNWTDAAERDARNNLTELGYVHEILAEFGDQAAGVFNRKYVREATKRGKELGIKVVDKVDYHATRCVGIDWDKQNAPTQIVVTEYNPSTDLFYPIHRSEIPSGEFTYYNAIKEIVRINEEFNPAFIYADRGHGEYQIEALHKYGEQHPESGLARKVKGVSFSDRIRIPDPVTKEIDNKDIKPFMVNQTVLLLENERIALPSNDSLIMNQMLDYYLERTTPTGRPIYSSENDHALDAFMLSLLAFTLEFTDIAKAKLTSQVAPAPKLDFGYNAKHAHSSKQEKAFTGIAFVDRDNGSFGAHAIRTSFNRRKVLRRPPKRSTF